MRTRISLIVAVAFGIQATAAQADVCTGNCGTLAPNGIVTAPPAYGPNYQYVSTFGGVTGAGRIVGIAGTNGSELVTTAFSGKAGDVLNFFFNYVTSDGSSSFTDYSFAELLNGGVHAAYLFTARTTPVGNTSPGFGLPANDSILTPITTPIVSGGPTWTALGGYSGACYSAGCGYTGWIGSNYVLGGSGLFSIRFGVTNFGDTSYDSGLAFAGLTINNVPVAETSVPEPGIWAMTMIGIGGIGAVLRRRRMTTGRVALA